MAEGQHREAIIEFFNVIQLDDTHRVANKHLGMALYETGQLGPALRYLQRTVEFDPTDNEARVRLATIYRYGGQLEEAREESGAVLQTDPTNMDALAVFADTVEEAREESGAVLQTDPTNMDALAVFADTSNSSSAAIVLAELNIRTGRHEQALAPLEDLAQRQPTALPRESPVEKRRIRGGSVGAAAQESTDFSFRYIDTGTNGVPHLFAKFLRERSFGARARLVITRLPVASFFELSVPKQCKLAGAEFLASVEASVEGTPWASAPCGNRHRSAPRNRSSWSIELVGAFVIDLTKDTAFSISTSSSLWPITTFEKSA